MELWFNQGSPFARKVRILVREKGLLQRITEVLAAVSPVEVNEGLARLNPLAKIPVLVLDSGDALYDSPVICEYLDSLHDGEKAFPMSASRRFAVLRQQALADGICDAAVLCRYERAIRPEALRWQPLIDAQMRKMLGALAELETRADTWDGEFDIGQIATVCALSYLDFRFADLKWRERFARLAQWQERMEARPSVAGTRPQ